MAPPQYSGLVVLLLIAFLLTACERTPDYGVQPGKVDARTMGLAATRNKSVFDNVNAGYSAFDDLSFSTQLAELQKRFDIHLLNDAEAESVREGFRKHYRYHAPGWWPNEPLFKATFFMGDYVVYLADNPSKRGFLMLRVARGQISVVPPPRIRTRPHYAEVVKRGDIARRAMTSNGIPVSATAVEHGSIYDEDRQIKLRLYSQNECGTTNDGPQSLGAISIVAMDYEDQTVKAVKQLPVPESIVPCYVEAKGKRKYVVDRALHFTNQMTSPQGNLLTLGINFRLGEDGMSWPGDTLQSKHIWIFWCIGGVDCELITQYTMPDQEKGYLPRGGTTAFAVGLDEKNRATLQEWSIDWGDGNSPPHTYCDRINVKSAWRLSQQAERIAGDTERIRKGPLQRTYLEQTKTYEYRPAGAIHRNRPTVFIGIHPGCVAEGK